MKKEIIIDIETVIKSDGVSESIVENYKGELLESDKNGNSYIFYKEKSEDGTVCDCRIVIGEKSLSLRKSGSSVVTMEFKENHDSSIAYKTMYGTFDFLLRTNSYNVIGMDDTRTVRIEYVLKNEDTVMSEHDMKIKIRPA